MAGLEMDPRHLSQTGRRAVSARGRECPDLIVSYSAVAT